MHDLPSRAASTRALGWDRARAQQASLVLSRQAALVLLAIRPASTLGLSRFSCEGSALQEGRSVRRTSRDQETASTRRSAARYLACAHGRDSCRSRCHPSGSRTSSRLVGVEIAAACVDGTPPTSRPVSSLHPASKCRNHRVRCRTECRAMRVHGGELFRGRRPLATCSPEGIRFHAGSIGGPFPII